MCSRLNKFYTTSLITVSKTIVLIDDDPDDLMVIYESIEQVWDSHTVLSFDKPESAIKYILDAGGQVGLIIADVNMPKLNGYQVRQAMLDNGGIFEAISFVLLSTSKSETDVNKARALNVEAYYKKPITMSGYRDIFLEIKSNHSF